MLKGFWPALSRVDLQDGSKDVALGDEDSAVAEGAEHEGQGEKHKPAGVCA